MVEYEEWRPIEGFRYYEISNLGNVRSLDHRVNSIYGTRLHRGKLLKKHSNKKRFGYVYIALRKDAIAYTRSVHRLVAKAFIPNQDGKPEVNHIDGDVTNNRVDNLEWVTTKENRQWTIKCGRQRISGERPIVATNIKTGEKICFKSVMEAHRRGFDRRRTWEAMNGKRNGYKGFDWAYV